MRSKAQFAWPLISCDETIQFDAIYVVSKETDSSKSCERLEPNLSQYQDNRLWLPLYKQLKDFLSCTNKLDGFSVYIFRCTVFTFFKLCTPLKR